MLIDSKIYKLWDKLADFSAEEVEESMQFLLAEICDILDADNASWAAVVKLSAPEKRVTIDGWRPLKMHMLRPMETMDEMSKDVRKRLEKGEIDPTAVSFQKDMGTFRILRWREMAPPEWYDSDHYKALYSHIGLGDILFVMVPINKDSESTFGFYRPGREHDFTKDDAELLAAINAPLKWLHHRVMLSQGLVIAEKPLSPMERRVQRLLLTDLSEKEIADRLNQNITTTHKHVTTVFRKMGVRGRAGLTALWLGSGNG
ncbi:LuxR C-terminal-related transcriptional regulator [Rubritalea sp.]|uniref:LuxR C-terminal-related transcriptional regulator n=1 Tax=Rubritalea sp. TaxID=2109375 RepID=UPI003EF19518